MNKKKQSLKYSKSSSFYQNSRSDFFEKNQSYLKKAEMLNELYSSQPKRKKCKICEEPLPKSVDFHSHKVDYVFCKSCTHLNGVFDDTKSFVEQVYIDDNSSFYSKNYIDEKFVQRTEDIYLPKVDFLLSILPPMEYDILDVGCGSGYFVFASILRKTSTRGFDLNKNIIEFGNKQIFHNCKKSPLRCVDEDSFFLEVKNTKSNIVSAINVIEHFREPHKFFEAFKLSKAKYLYYSVPMFSLSVVFENVFKNVFPRQLSADHTHLFTEKSICKMHDLIGVNSIGEWRFGTDIMDMYRSLLINLQSNNSSQKMIDYMNKGFGIKIDDIQSILDKNHFCSEIHVVASKP